MSAAELENEKTVSLTTFRKDGTGVDTPIWLRRTGDTLLMGTDSDSWKIKRLRNNPNVALRPCSMSGKIADGAATFEGTARIIEGAEGERLHARVMGRYGLQAKIIGFFTKLTGRESGEKVAIEISF